MGKGIIEVSTGTVNEINRDIGNTGQSGNSSSAESANTAGTGNNTRTDSEYGITATAENTEVVGENSVKKTKSKEERNAERRRKYAEEKAKNGGTVKPRKVTKNKSQPTNTLQIEMLITTLFTIIGNRPGMEIWILQPEEVKAISEPLGKIIAENEAFRELGEHSDAIALVTACFAIFVPRFLISFQKEKEKKKNERTGNTTDVLYKKGKTERSITDVPAKNTNDNPPISEYLYQFGMPTA